MDGDDTPLETARKELKEEVGLEADTWQELGIVYPSENGAMADHNYIFLARDLRTVPRRVESGEAIRPPKAIPWQEVLDMIKQSRFTDGQSLSALLHYILWRGKL